MSDPFPLSSPTSRTWTYETIWAAINAANQAAIDAADQAADDAALPEAHHDAS